MVFGTGATANVACFEWLRNPGSLPKDSGCVAARPYLALACSTFGKGQVGTAHHPADAPITLAGQMGVFARLLAEQDFVAAMSKGALDSLKGHPDLAQKELHLRKIWATSNFRSFQAGHYFPDVGDLAGETPRRTPTKNAACGTSPRAANPFWQLTLPGTASSNPSAGKCYFRCAQCLSCL